MSAAGIAPPRLIIDAAAPLFRKGWEEWCAIGAAAVLATVLVDADTLAALSQLGAWFRSLREHRDRLRLAGTAADVRRAAQDGKTAVVLHFQSSRPLGYDVGLVEVFKRLRVGVIQLAYNVRDPLGDGSLEATDRGLSRLGHEVIKEMNRCGIVVDCSHAGVRTSLDGQHLTADDLIDHIAHISELVVVEHVGLGLDFFEATPDEYRRLIEVGIWDEQSYPPPPYRYPAGIEGPSAIPSLVDHLSRRGFDREAIDGVLGGNFLRVFERVWPTGCEVSD